MAADGLGPPLSRATFTGNLKFVLCLITSNTPMANIIRSAKSGNDWTINDLNAYHIKVVFQDATTFFETESLPMPSVEEEVLKSQYFADAQSDDASILLCLLDFVASPPYEESAVDDFAVQLFRVMKYTGIGRIARTMKSLHFFICGEEREAKTNVCILNDDDTLLLVQENEGYQGLSDPEPKLIANAIAAFDTNNRIRVQTLGVPPLESKVMAGLVMKGTMPTFYKVPVTSVLVDCIQLGQYPATETIVYAHIPKVNRPACQYSEGMKPLDNRAHILSCYEAFKKFL